MQLVGSDDAGWQDEQDECSEEAADANCESNQQEDFGETSECENCTSRILVTAQALFGVILIISVAASSRPATSSEN